MALIDRQYLRRAFYGSRRMTAWLQSQGHIVNRKRVQRLMRLTGIESIYQRQRTSRPAPDHRIYPYLLRGLVVEHVNQAWAADICYIPMAHALYLFGRSYGLGQPLRAGLAPLEPTRLELPYVERLTGTESMVVAIK
jgi:transposase InsO family protein